MHKILIFGCGNAGQKIFQKIKNSFQILAFVDNNKKLQGTRIFEKEVVLPEKIKEFDYDFLLIASMYKNEIKIQLVSQNIVEPYKIVFDNELDFLLSKVSSFSTQYTIDNVLLDFLLDELLNNKLRSSNMMHKIAYLLKSALKGKKLNVDVIQSAIIGTQAYEACLKVPIYEQGYMKDTEQEINVFFSSKSANKTLTNLISKKIPLLIDENFGPFTKYATYDWKTSKYSIDDSIYDDFFDNNGYLFKDFIDFRDTNYGLDYIKENSFKLAVNMRKSKNKFNFSDKEIIAGNRFLTNVVGLNENDWFVCVYARDGGYYKETEKSQNWFRNSDINTYKLAIDEIISRGGYVIRIGSHVCNKLNYEHPKVFDYSYSSYQSDFLDIYLLSRCRFFMGSYTGLSHVNSMFSTPELYLNVINCHGGNADIWIPKKMIDIDTKKYISYKEFFRRYNKYERALLAENGLNQRNLLRIEYIDNTPEEIQYATIDMLNMLEGNKLNDQNIEVIKYKVGTSIKISDEYQNIANSFILENKQLFSMEND